MAAAEALSIQNEGPASTGDPTAVPEAAAVPKSGSPRWPQLMPAAQVVAVVLGVLAVIWNQQQTTDGLRTELRAEITQLEASLRTELRAEITQLEASLRSEIAGLRSEIASLRSEVRSNGERLARIEGFLGIGIPETAAPP